MILCPKFDGSGFDFVFHSIDKKEVLKPDLPNWGEVRYNNHSVFSYTISTCALLKSNLSHSGSVVVALIQIWSNVC